MTEEAGEKTVETTEELGESSESSTEETQETTEESTAQPQNRAEKRIKQLTRKQREAEREAAYWRDIALQKQQQTEPPKGTQTRPQRPTLEQSKYDEAAHSRALDEYEDKLTDWKFQQKWAEQQQAQRQQQEEARKQQHSQTLRQKVIDVYDKGADKFDDFEDVVNSVPPSIMTMDVVEAILETENPEDVSYYLGKNLDEAEKIAGMSPLKRAVAIGKLEVKLSQPPPKKTTSAPPPPSKLSGQHVSTVDIDKMPVKEYIRLRNEGKI